MSSTKGLERSNRLEIAALFFIARAAFFYFTGGAILNPTNVKWLYWGDPATSYLGWQFFRDTALFQFPIGATPSYGAGFSASIMYTDSLPIIGIPLKFLSPLLPDQFQYFGAWIYASFFFQIYFAWKLLALRITNVFFRIAGSSLFLLAPVFLYRFVHQGSGHIGFTNEFLILWTFYMVQKQEKGFKSWCFLICATTLLSLGILPMVLFIFITYLFIDALRVRRNFIPDFKLLLSSVAVFYFVYWILGGTMVANSSSEGFGIYKSTLLSFFDPRPPLDFSWSQVFGDLASPIGTEEGFSFLGISGLIIALFAIIPLFKKMFDAEYMALISACVVMFIFSLSNQILIGQRVLFSYTIPDILKPVFDTLRSSGRFTWPLIFLLLVEGLFGLSTMLKRFHSVYIANGIIVLLLVIQLFDMSIASSEIRERFTKPGFTASLTDPKWNELAKQYKHLAAVPPLNNDPGWFELALLADKWHMTSNAAYYGRIDENRLMSENDRLQTVLNEQKFDSNTLYVITNYPPNPASPILLDRFKDVAAISPGTHVYELDGFVVVAP